jgi:hypothetical protein
MTRDRFTTCIHCGAIIDTTLGAAPPDGQYRAGNNTDPAAPGDWDNICDLCNYGAGLQGGPGAVPHCNH